MTAELNGMAFADEPGSPPPEHLTGTYRTAWRSLKPLQQDALLGWGYSPDEVRGRLHALVPGAFVAEDDTLTAQRPSDQPTGPTPRPAAASLADRLLHRADLDKLPQPEPIIEDTLDARTVAVLSGRHSTGKSFLALGWSCSIATGAAWQGRPVLRPGRVLYVAAEGAYGLHQRVAAWEHAWRHPVETLDVLPLPVNLFTGARFDELLELVTTKKYVFIVIDTWARSTVGGQENNNSDATAAFERVDQLRQQDSTVLVVAHTDAGDNKTRGATALDDNADTLYRMRGGDGLLELTREKRKDGPQGDRLLLRLTPTLDSCVLESARGQDHDLSDRSGQLLSAFRECYGQIGCTKAELRISAGLPSATFDRSVKALVTGGFLVNEGTDKRPFYKPGASYVE